MLRETHAIPQEVVLSQDKSEFFGCFLDSHNSSVNWVKENLMVNRVSNSFQKEYTSAHHHVEYPVLCYTGVKPDVAEINIVNLVDPESPVTKLEL